MTGVPKVSVCVPCFNAAAFIGETIRSVQAQTFTDWELVIVDDLSTDATRDIIKSFDDPRIRVVLNEQNLGVAANWTKAVDHGRGEYLKVLCHDDLLYPTCLERQVAVLDDVANAGVVIVSSSRDVVDATCRPIVRNRRAKSLQNKVPGPTALRAVVRSGTNPLGEPGAVMFRKSASANVGGFDGRSIWMIDIDMWVRLLQQGDLYVLPQTLSAFRVSSRALSTQLANRQSAEAYALFVRLRKQYPQVVRRSDLAIGRVRAAILQRLRSLVYRGYLRS